MKKLAFVETENTSNETIEKLKLVADIRRHIFEFEDAYEAYKPIADFYNEIEEENKKAEEAEKLARATEKKNQKFANKADKETKKANKHELMAEKYAMEVKPPELIPVTTEEA